MTAEQKSARILVVANRTGSTPDLLEEVRRRAREGASVTLLIPPLKSAAAAAADWSAADALDLLGRAAGEPVAQLDAGSDAAAAVHRAVDAGAYDEIILSIPQEHLAHWIHHDLRHRLEHLGLPVLVIPPEPDAPLPGHLRDGMPDTWTTRPVVPGGDGAFEI